MYTTIDFLRGCSAGTIESHRFNNISIKCFFKCKNPGYKTYRNLHGHYLNKHNICLHKVAHLDPNDEDGFRRQVEDSLTSLTSLTGRQAANQASGRGCATPIANYPSAASPSSQIAGPSNLRNPGMASHPVSASLGQGSRANLPSCYAGPAPIGALYQIRSPSPKLPTSGETGPSRSSVVHPTPRYQPYPQPWPQQQGLSTNHSLVRGQAKGKARELPPVTTNNDLQMLSRVSPRGRPESALSTVSPHDSRFVESPQYQSTDTVHLRLQQTATGTPTPVQWMSESRYPIDTMAPGRFCRLPISQEHISSARSIRESEGPVQVDHPGRRDPQSGPSVAGPRSPTIYFPIPPTETSLPGDTTGQGPISDQPKRSQQRAGRKQRLRSLFPPATGAPPPGYAVRQPLSHPYSRPANGSTTSQLARQVRGDRRRELSTEADGAREIFTQKEPTVVVDARCVGSHRQGGQNRIGTRIHETLEAQEKAVALVARQDRLDSPHLEPPSPCIRPTGSCSPSRSGAALVACSVSRPSSETALEGLSHQRISGQISDIQRFCEPPAVRGGPGLSEARERVPGKESSAPAVSAAAEQSRIANVSTPTVAVVREPSRGSAPIELLNPAKCSPTKVASEGGGQKEGSSRDSFPEVSWGGWRLIRTPDGIYLPETFSPFPHELDDLTDLLSMTEDHGERGLK